MKAFKILLSIYFVFGYVALFSQSVPEKKVVITGVRFAYPILEKWIAAYKEANPSVRVVIESRTNVDPASYDLLIEAYEPEKNIKEDREYLYFGRYALLPIANSNSQFAKIYSDKGLTEDLIKQVFFNDIYADKEKQKEIRAPFKVYTRLQKAGAPVTFARYFGFSQENIKGKAIAGADEHLIKALLRDTIGISYSNPGLIYDLDSRKVLSGLSIIPVDADDNGRVSNDEKFYADLDHALVRLEEGSVKNVPLEYLHLSLPKHGYNAEALRFLLWVIDNSQDDLHQFGFLKPEPKRFEDEKEKFEQLTRR
jgi:phosphate transport system substrate-binding protein